MIRKVTAKQVKEIRDRFNESQAEFSTRFYVDQSTIARWEIKGPPRTGPAVMALRQLLDQVEERAS